MIDFGTQQVGKTGWKLILVLIGFADRKEKKPTADRFNTQRNRSGFLPTELVEKYRQHEGKKTDSREVVSTDRFNTSAQLKLKRIYTDRTD